MRATAAERTQSTSNPYLICAAAWLIPGAGHLLHGRLSKAVWFFVLLSLMYAIGLGFAGRLFPFQLAEPLVFLAAISEWSLGAPRW